MSKLIDLTGQKFGHLTVTKRGENTKSGQVRWWCKCDCNNPELILVIGSHLRDGHTKSCGKCLKAEDLTGQMFNNWLVLERAEDYISPKGEKCVQWLCECQCENKTRRIIRADILKHGKSKSCGCLYKNEYDLESYDYGVGWTIKGEPFYFDKEDYDKIKNYVWHYDKDQYLCANYIKSNGIPSTIKMYRIIMNLLDVEDLDPDHIRYKNYDNRKSQLRIATQTQNNMNTKIPITNTSGYKGVSFNKEKQKYEAYITMNKNIKHLGYYNTKEEAAKIRKEAEENYFGEWSYDNSMKL